MHTGLRVDDDDDDAIVSVPLIAALPPGKSLTEDAVVDICMRPVGATAAILTITQQQCSKSAFFSALLSDSDGDAARMSHQQ